MMTHAYSKIYLNKASRAVGNMLHEAVYSYNKDGNDFLKRFIQSGLAEEIEMGSPKYIAGKSGIELFAEVEERTLGESIDIKVTQAYDKSDAYWVGWILTHYQWHSGRSFESLLDTIPFDELLGLYSTLHEADVNKSFEVFDEHFNIGESKLKKIRTQCGLTQQALSNASGISINTIRAYERKSKDLNKARLDITMRLSNALKCKISDLIQ